MTIPVQRFLVGQHRWQTKVLTACDDSPARFFVLEWHRRARKTTLAINLLIRECAKNPKSSYVYVGPTYRQARGIIWDDPNMLDAYLPDKAEIGWKKNEQKLQVRFGNGSLLTIRGADDPDALRGIDAVGVVFDEWAMMKLEVWLEIFRPIIAQDVSRWAMFLYTPQGENHATDMLAYARADETGEWYAETLKASESGILPAEELLKAGKEMPPTLYYQEFECAHITDEECVLISSRLIDELQNYETVETDVRRLVSCDPSLGGDECAILAGENGRVIDELYLHERDSMKIAGHLGIMGEKHQTPYFIIDTSDRLGAAIADRLRELGFQVEGFNSSERPMDKNSRCYNRRAEAWWAVMQAMQDHDLEYIEDAETRRQLASVRYRPRSSARSGQFQLELKEVTKKRLGRSPDRADAYVMLMYGMPHLSPLDVVQRQKRRWYEPASTGVENDWRAM